MNNHQRNQSLTAAINKKFQHDLSHQHLTTMDFFRLQPLACIEAVAGDKMSINVRSLVESAPLATKVYGSFHLDLHAFFVPFRLLWSQWNNYYYSNTDAQTTGTLALPYADFSLKMASDLFTGTFSTNVARRKIFGSLGYPTTQFSKDLAGTSPSSTPRLISAMPARAYQLIWWDWFRDSVNIPEVNKNSYIATSGGHITGGSLSTLFTPRYRTFRKDYITTILSQASASLPGATAEIESSPISSANLETFTNSYPLRVGTGADGASVFAQGTPNANSVTGTSLLQYLRTPVMRGAIALQRWLERLGVTGTRPLERIVSNFGIRPEPSRLQMSELIGTKSITLNVDGLLNTGSQGLMSQEGATLDGNAFGSSSESFFGTQTGKSVSSGQTDTWTYSADEHGYIMVIGSIMPNYINDGFLDPLFTRGLSAKSEGSVDFFVPEMDGSGYTPVLLGQVATPLRWNATESWKNADIDQVVGYVPRYEDYRYIMDKISGDFNEQQSEAYMRNMALVRSLSSVMVPDAVVAGTNLTTPTEADKALFDNHFQVTDQSLDHFVVNNFIVVDAEREISSAVLPTELSNLANKDLVEVARGGIRL